jgi:signal transduction histidine kinase
MVVVERPTKATAPALAVAAASTMAVAGVAVAASLPWYTTYAAVSPSLLVTDAAAAVALVGGGLALSMERPQDARPTLLVLASAAWASADWVGWQGGPDVMRTMGVVGYAALLPLVAHIVVHTWPAWRRLRLAMPWLYAVTLALVVARLAVVDPRIESSCWQNCTANSLFVVGQPQLAAGLLRASLVIAILTGLALVAAGASLAVAGHPLSRTQHLPLLLPAATLGAASAAQAALVLSGSVENALDRRFVVLHLVVAGALIGLALGAGLIVIRARRPKRHTGELARSLALSRDQSVATLLGRALGDTTVQVTYRVRDPHGWVDSTGRRLGTPDASPAPGVVPVTRGGELIALVRYDPDTAPDIDLPSALSPAARLALENESLEAQQRTRLDDLRDSQRRIVEGADVERARLERNLHDAAQASVLGVIATVQRALRGAREAGDLEASRLLAAAAVDARATMDELRLLARGIHPAILDLEGLAPALEALADHAEIRVEVAVREHERLPPEVERTVYSVAADIVREAARLGEDDLLIGFHVTGDWVVLDVDGTRQAPLDAVQDRVGAQGGMVLRNGKLLEVRLPCV